MPTTSPSADRGQATVEFAIALPLVVVLLLGVVQVAVVVGDQLAVELAAREGARAGAVAAAPAPAAERAARAATDVEPIDVSTTATATRVTVTVTHTSRSVLPIVGRLIGDVEVSATVVMAREPP